jgi:hypothetical protein
MEEIKPFGPVQAYVPVETLPVKLIALPTQTGELLEAVAVGIGLTVMVAEVGLLEQPVVELVKVIFALPAPTPVTTPPLVMDAIPALLLDQVPPVEGVKFNVPPIQTRPDEGTVTVGAAFTTTVVLEVAVHVPTVMVKL